MSFMLNVLSGVFTLQNIFLMFSCVLLGIIIGAIPGLTVMLGVILLLPLTYGMNTVSALVALLAIYVGGCYGGSISAILINTPGTNSALATTLDGYPLTKQGKPNKALSTSLFASFMGGLLSAILLLVASAPIAVAATKFRSPEYFSLSLFGLTVIAGVCGDNIIKGIIAAAVGIFISCIGLESLSGTLRYTFDTVFLFGGISVLPALIGLIALAQVIIQALEVKNAETNHTANTKVDYKEDPPLSWKEKWSIMPTILKSTAIASVIGIMPGAGGEVAQFMCYNEARRASKHPEEFGHGSLEGVAAAESSNNAVVGSAMIPLLTMGIPGDGVTAILLGAFILHGLQPGPTLLTEQPLQTYSIIVGLIFCNILLYLEGKVFTRLVSKVIKISYKALSIAIVLFCFAGAFANSGSVYEMIMIVPLALAGYYLGKLGFSVIPMMLGLILGHIVEVNFTRSMIISNGNPMIFFTEPISCVILILAVLFTVLVMHMNRKMEKKMAAEGLQAKAEG